MTAHTFLFSVLDLDPQACGRFADRCRGVGMNYDQVRAKLNELRRRYGRDELDEAEFEAVMYEADWETSSA